jgi:hypothetical protein
LENGDSMAIFMSIFNLKLDRYLVVITESQLNGDFLTEIAIFAAFKTDK